MTVTSSFGLLMLSLPVLADLKTWKCVARVIISMHECHKMTKIKKQLSNKMLMPS